MWQLLRRETMQGTSVIYLAVFMGFVLLLHVFCSHMHHDSNELRMFC